MKPIGQITADPQDHEDVVGRLDKLAQEASEATRPWLQREQENLEIFTYGTRANDYDDDDGAIIVNEIQSAILATAPKEPAKVELTPVETNDPGVIVQVPQQVPVVDPVSGMPAVDELTGEPLQQVTFVPFQVNDLVVKKVYQKVFDWAWQRSRLDEILRRGRIWTRVKGFQFYLYSWDDDELAARLRTLSNAQCYPDRIQEFVKDFAYFGVDEYLDAEFAKSLYPQLSEQIDERATEGEQSTSVGNQVTPERFKGNFQRGMVCLTTFWLRFQKRPMTPDEAVQSGKLTQVMLPTGNMVPAVDELGGGLIDDYGNPITEPEMREGLALEDGTETVEGDENWPQKQVIREIQVLAGAVVTDRECEHWDIPILHDVHIPVFGTPFGIGDPFKLKKMQAAGSRMLDSMVQYSETFAQPIRWLPQSVFNAVKQEYGTAYIDPSQIIIVPDHVLQQTGGKLDFSQNPPQMNQSLPQTYGIIKSTISEQSGYTQELRGVASNPDQSGRQTALLSQNASSLNEFMGRSEEEVIYRLSRLILHSITTRLDEATISKISSEYPPEVLTAIIDKARSIDWDIKVTVSTGSGMLNEAKQAVWQNWLAMGAISMQTYRELSGIDHEQEEKRVMMQAQTALATQAQAAASGPQKEDNANVNPA